MNNDLNNNTPSNDSLYTNDVATITDDSIENVEPDKDSEESREKQEKVEKVEKDLSLPTTIEDYMNLSKNFYAGFWSRVVAFLIDLIVVYATASLLNTLSFGLLNKQLDFPILGEESLSYVIVVFTYFIAMTYFFSQTLGKMIMKIKVETNKGDKLSFTDVIYRELVGRLLTI